MLSQIQLQIKETKALHFMDLSNPNIQYFYTHFVNRNKKELHY